MVAISALALLGPLAGCVSLFPNAKPVQLYRFGDSLSAAASADAAPPPLAGGHVGIVIASIGFPRESASDNILTMTGDRAAYVAGARWVAPARILFEEAARDEFLGRTKRAVLLNLGDPSVSGVALRMDVTSFEVRLSDSRRSAPVVRVALNARLTGMDGKVLGQKDFVSEAPLTEERLALIVKGYDDATRGVLDAVGQWVDAVVGAG